MVGAEAAADLEAVEFREHHVKHDEVRRLLGYASERLRARAGGAHVVTRISEAARDQRTQFVVVFNNQKVRAHGSVREKAARTNER